MHAFEYNLGPVHMSRAGPAITRMNSSSISYVNFIPGLGPGVRFVETSSIRHNVWPALFLIL